MKYFNPLNPEYTPPYDLNVYNQVATTLQKRHDTNLELHSNIYQAFKAMDFNEQEDAWVQGKSNEIDAALQNGTIDDLAAFANKNLLAAKNNILFGADTIGRLKAQQDYKANLKAIDAAKIPEEYKEMYRELNPYHYEDKYDENGNIIGGTKWQPNVRPVDTIDLSQIIVKGINIAAKESGGGSATQWLDANGNVTTNPAEAYDGQVYNSTTNQWERLGRDKILKGIKSMIESTPGAKASLKQDYDYAAWKYNKDVQENDGRPVVSDYTDQNGNPLTEDEYLMKRIMPGVEAAEYFNSKSSTSYGTGLASYKAAQAALATKAAQDNQAFRNQFEITGAHNAIEFENNITPVDVNANVTAAMSDMQELYRQITGSTLYVDPSLNKISIDKLIEKHNIDADTASILLGSVSAYNDALAARQAYRDGLSDADKTKFDFITRLNTGNGFVASSAGGSVWDDQIIKAKSEFWGKDGVKASIHLTPAIRQQVESMLNGGEFNGAAKLNITIDENNNLIFNRNNDNILPLVASIINKSEQRANMGVINTVFDWMGFGDHYDVTVYDKNNNRVGAPSQYISSANPGSGLAKTDYVNKSNDAFKQLSKYYNNGSNMESQLASNSPKVEKFTLTNLNFEGTNFTAQSLFNQYENGYIDQKTYNAKTKYYNNTFENAVILGANYSAASIYGLSDEYTDGVSRKLDPSTYLQIGEEIKSAYKDNRLKWSPTMSANENNPLMPEYGYNITILPKADTKGNIPEDAQPKTYTVFNIGRESAAQELMQDPGIRNIHKAQVIAATKGSDNLSLSGENPVIGTTSIKGIDDNTILMNFLGQQIVTSPANAAIVGEQLEYFRAVKRRGYDDSNTRNRQVIANCAMKIGEATGIGANIILDYLVNDLTYGH